MSSKDTNVPNEAVNAIRRGFDTISKIQQDSSDTGVRWVAVTELGYAATHPNPNRQSVEGENGPEDVFHQETVCFTCGIYAELRKCSHCGVATYCSKGCQLVDWKYGSTPKRSNVAPPTEECHLSSTSLRLLPHKRTCAAYQRIGPNRILSQEADRRIVREELLTKIRFYASPYAVHNTIVEGIGRGFLFLQSNATLAQVSLPTGACILTRWWQSTPRSVLLHYLTLGEYDQELCRDDFELACVREELKKALESYVVETQVVYLMRFRCGHLSVGIAPLVPDYPLSCQLAKDYYGDHRQCQPIQLNLDDD